MYLQKKKYYVVDVLQIWYIGITDNANMTKWFCIFGKDNKYFVNC